MLGVALVWVVGGLPLLVPLDFQLCACLGFLDFDLASLLLGFGLVSLVIFIGVY